MKRSRIKLPLNEYLALTATVLHRDKWRCRVCKKRSNLTAHHIVYRSHGGDDAEWNLLTMCNHCHEAEHQRWLKILPPVGLDPNDPDLILDANQELTFVVVGEWIPGRPIPNPRKRNSGTQSISRPCTGEGEGEVSARHQPSVDSDGDRTG